MKTQTEFNKIFDRDGVRRKNIMVIFRPQDLEGRRKGFKPAKLRFFADLREFGIQDNNLSNKIVLNWLNGLLGVSFKSIDNLLQFQRERNSKPFFIKIRGENRFCFVSKQVSGSLTIGADWQISGFKDELIHDNIKDLAGVERIKGNLILSRSDIESLGSLKQIDGVLHISQSFAKDDPRTFTNLKTLGNLGKVGGNVTLKNSSIETLGKLKHVGGHLNIRNMNLKNLGFLEVVAGNILVSEQSLDKIDFTGIRIGGKLKVFKN